MRYVSILFLFSIFLPATRAQWVRQAAPKVNIINEIHGDNSGSVLAVTAIKGAFRSTDQGNSWSAQDIGGDNQVKHFSVDGDTVFSIKTSYPDLVKIHKSTFSSSTFTEVYSGNLSGSLNPNFLGSSALFIVTTPEVFHVSTNRGASWTAVQSGLPNFNGTYNMSVSAILRTGATIYASFDNGWGVYRSDNNGLTWKATNHQLPNRYVYSLLYHNNKLYAGTYNNYIAYLNAGDTSWQVLTSGPKGSKAIYVNQNNIFAAGEPGILRSTNSGISWDTLKQGIQTGDGIKSIVSGSGKIYAAGLTGFYSSSDNGTNWNSLNSGFPGENFGASDITFLGDTLLLGSASGIYRSPDNGNSWQFSGSGAPASNVFSLHSFNGYLFAAVGAVGGGTIFRSADAGRSWVESHNGIPTFVGVSSITSGNTTLYASTQNGLYRSNDNGLNWEDANGGLSFSTRTTEAIGGNVYMSCQYGSNPGTWFTSNSGTNWTNISSGLPDASTDPVIKFYNTGGSITALTGNGLLFSTTNQGSSWNALFTNIPGGTMALWGYQSGNSLALSTYSGPYFSANATEWVLKDEGLTSAPFDIRPVSVHGGTIYAVAEVYMFTRPFSEVVTSAENTAGNPVTYRLMQNYPNPFNPSTSISYSIPQQLLVQIKVFDVLGNEIETLANEEKSAGTYEINWHAKDLPSGVYFYQLKAGDFIEAKKMILMK